MMKKQNSKGFTLIEIMVVVAIMAILTMIAVPSYEAYKKKAKRGECKVTLSEITSSLEKQKIAYKRYSKIPLNKVMLDADGKTICGTSDSTSYTISIGTVSDGLVTDDKWELTATPSRIMKDTGELKVNFRGEKCWDRDNTGTACDTLSNSSSWND